MKSRQCNLSSVCMRFVDSQAFLNEYAVVRLSTPESRSWSMKRFVILTVQ